MVSQNIANLLKPAVFNLGKNSGLCREVVLQTLPPCRTARTQRTKRRKHSSQEPVEFMTHEIYRFDRKTFFLIPALIRMKTSDFAKKKTDRNWFSPGLSFIIYSIRHFTQFFFQKNCYYRENCIFPERRKLGSEVA